VGYSDRDVGGGEIAKIKAGNGSGIVKTEGRASTNINKPRSHGKNGGKSENKNNTKANNNTLGCFYVNARSIMNKVDELQLYVEEEKPDIIGITETWVFEDVLDSEINIDGYTTLRKDRISGNKSRGGGVLLYIKNDISVTRRDELVDEHFSESLWCDIEVGNEKTLIGICYRPPASLKVNDEGLFNLISIASKHKVLIMGDFNFPELNWGEAESLDDSHPFLKCINDNYLLQGVVECTRGKNILDLVLTSEENMVENLRVGEPFGTSDHLIIRWDFAACRENIKEDIKTHDYFRTDYDQLREEAKLINWDRIVEGKSVETDWEKFKLKIGDLRDKWVPFKKARAGKCKWVTRLVTKCRRAKNKAWYKYKESGKNPELYAKFISKQNKSQRANRTAKRNFEHNLARNVKENSKSFFAYVRSKQRTKDRVGPLKDNLGQVVSDDLNAANLLNDYFSSVFTLENKTDIPIPIKMFHGNMEKEGLLNININREAVEKKLEYLDVNKCPGVDSIHPKLLFELRKEISVPLAKLFSCSLQSGTVPLDWKDAGVIPLFKKGTKTDPQNYRPVSLTSLICKIMESILKDSILNHLEIFSLIRDSQHGFRKGRSCLTNLLEFMEVVTNELDDGKPVDVIFLDFAKAFDKVPYERLFRKLTSHGIGGRVAEWIKEWLTNRRQKVCINKKYSDWSNVLSGVPQGSVLGPLLFLIYINDIDEEIISKLGKFADDTKLCRGVTDGKEVETLRNDLAKIFKWSIDWQMLFNVDKCTVVHMGKNNMRCDYKLGDTVINKAEKERDLGVIMGKSGKSSEQCVAAVKKANTVLGMIKRNICFKSKEIIVKLYKALVRPRLEYCIQAWCPYLRKDIDSLERVQRRATKLIEGYKDLSYEDRLDKTGLISLEKRRVRGDLIQVFKMINGIDKIDYRKFFEMSGVHRTRGHNCRLIKKRSKLDIRKYFFSQRVVNSWNVLPQEVVDATSVNAFKNRLDKFNQYCVG
jgi:ribonucleases P/MRP protein subunit RPP40